MTPRKHKPDPGAEFADIWALQLTSQRHHRLVTYGLAGVLFILLLIVFRLSDVQPPKPIVIRVDDVGRAEALAYEAVEAAPTPTDPTTKYFLNQFVSDYYGRRAANVQTAWPRALLFLEASLSRQAATEQTDSVALLAAGRIAAQRVVENVTIRIIPTPLPPYQATVDFDLVSSAGTGIAAPTRRRWTASIHFVFLRTVPGNLLPVNPLGLVITYLQADPVAAF